MTDKGLLCIWSAAASFSKYSRFYIKADNKNNH